LSSSSLLVDTGLPSAEITLLDHTGTVVATSSGRLHATGLDAGLYRVQVSAAATVTEELIELHDGDSQFKSVRPELPMVTPVKDAAINHQLHARPAGDLSINPMHSIGHGGRLVVFARVLDKPEDFPGVELPPVTLDSLRLLDLQGNPLHPPWGTEEATGPGYAGISLDLYPGTYLLRSPEGSGTSDQAVVVPDGWTAYLFMPAWPPEQDTPGRPWVPASEAMVCHLKAYGNYFEPYDFGSDAVFAAEAALEGLRTGHVAVPSGDWDQALAVHVPVNPMLGLYLGHAVLNWPGPPLPAASGKVAGGKVAGGKVAGGKMATRLKRDRDLARAAELAERLEHIIPGHPDVVALRCAVKDLRCESTPSFTAPLTNPPMLHASYQALLARDATEPELLAEGTLAELAATRLRGDSMWARWDSPSQAPERVHVAPSTMTEAVTALEGIVDISEVRNSLATADTTEQRFHPFDIGAEVATDAAWDADGLGVGSAPQARLPLARQWFLPPAVESPLPEELGVQVPEGATVPREVAQIAKMLRLMAEYRDDDSDRVSVADLSRHLGLPVSLVRAALTRIVRQF
jgi:hypothetical protein